jgi:hypothetical protein
LQSNEIENGNIVNQWAALNRLLYIYKAVGAALALVCVLLTGLCMILANNNPVVAVVNDGDYLMLQGRRKSVDLNEANISRFVEQYVRTSREWKTLEPEKIAQSVAPFVTDGFRSKVLEVLRLKKTKEFADKEVRQDVSGLSVKVTNDKTVAVFDVVLRVNGIPLIVPTQIGFDLARGPSTQVNPLGLYVNGETLHEGK